MALIKRPNTAAAEFFGKLFHCRDEVHQYHLQTRSFSEHKATQSLYESILDHADRIIEVYQGTRKETIDFKVPVSQCPTNIVEYLTEMNEYLKEYKLLFESDIQNIIEELLADLHQTIYKLTFLK